MTPKAPPPPPTPDASDRPADDASVAGEEDPGAGEDDPALREALRREAEVVSRTDRPPTP